MSRFAAISPITGKFEDIVWRHSPWGPEWSDVMLGDWRMGMLSRSSYDGWTAIAEGRQDDLAGLRSVKGFRTRWHATEYLLRATKVWPDVP